MTEHSEQMLNDFFRPVAEMEVADDGFTERVMKRLSAPRRSSVFRRSRLWTAFCVALFAVLFVVLRGWDSVLTWLEVLVRTAPAEHSLLTWGWALGVLFVLWLAEVVPGYLRSNMP